MEDFTRVEFYGKRKLCRSGEIGKRAALKMLWEQSLVGSSPTFGTFFILQLN